MQLSPQQIISDILPAMKARLGAGEVMKEARASAPSTDIHFDRSAPAQTAPLVDIQTPDVAAIFTLQQQAPGMS